MTVKWRSRLKKICILLAVFLASCQPQTALHPTSTMSPPLAGSLTLSPQSEKQSSLIVDLNGFASLKREGWKDYQGAGFGTIIKSTDLLKTEGEIWLFCAETRTVKRFVSTVGDRNPCPRPTTGNSLIYDGMLFEPSKRAAPARSIPYILYPRGTAIMESRPLLHWNDTSASSYTVEIRIDDKSVWKKVDATQAVLAYPADVPALKPDTNYLLIVTDNDTGNSSSSDPDKGLGFEVVGKDQHMKIEAQQDAILNTPDLNPAAQKLLLALFFDQTDVHGRGLWGEAAALLDKVSSAQPISPAVRLYRGACLAKMKLWREAASEFESVLEQAKEVGDMESQARAQASLWHITREEGYYQQAIKLYQELGAQEWVQALEQEHP